MRRTGSRVTALLIAAALTAGAARGADPGLERSGEWRHFGNDLANSKYSPLDQIDRTNFHRLEIAWRWESISQQIAAENKGVRPSQFKPIPLVVDGLMYVATEVAQVVALDPATGAIVWQHDPESWKAGRPANLGFQHRGVAYWRRGDDARIFITTHDRRLIGLDARTGKPVPRLRSGWSGRSSTPRTAWLTLGAKWTSAC